MSVQTASPQLTPEYLRLLCDLKRMQRGDRVLQLDYRRRSGHTTAMAGVAGKDDAVILPARHYIDSIRSLGCNAVISTQWYDPIIRGRRFNTIWVDGWADVPRGYIINLMPLLFDDGIIVVLGASISDN